MILKRRTIVVGRKKKEKNPVNHSTKKLHIRMGLGKLGIVKLC